MIPAALAYMCALAARGSPALYQHAAHTALPRHQGDGSQQMQRPWPGTQSPATWLQPSHSSCGPCARLPSPRRNLHAAVLQQGGQAAARAVRGCGACAGDKRPRTAGHELEVALEHAVGERGRVLQHLLLVRLELRAGRLLQRDRQARDRVVMRPAVRSRASPG
jgi:hypothetical protein